MRSYIIFILLLILTGCGQPTHMAPVVESQWRPYNPQQRLHKVSRGETLYSIAFRYDKDYRQLAANNHLSPPYNLYIGQVLYLQGAHAAVKNMTYPISQPRHVHPLPSRPYANKYAWRWPAHGRVVASYAPTLGKKGIDIAGKKGAPIYAAAAGVVAYAGNGLSGYGNLIIIKHDNQFLTAYGHNLRNRVKEGQRVKAGQVIADMGMISNTIWGLHFEIRQAGQPINPLRYLRY